MLKSKKALNRRDRGVMRSSLRVTFGQNAFLRDLGEISAASTVKDFEFLASRAFIRNAAVSFRRCFQLLNLANTQPPEFARRNVEV